MTTSVTAQSNAIEQIHELENRILQLKATSGENEQEAEETSLFLKTIPKDILIENILPWMSPDSFLPLSGVNRLFHQLIWHPNQIETISGKNYKRLLVRYLIKLQSRDLKGKILAGVKLNLNANVKLSENAVNYFSNKIFEISDLSSGMMEIMRAQERTIVDSEFPNSGLLKIIKFTLNPELQSTIQQMQTLLISHMQSVQQFMSTFYQKNAQALNTLSKEAEQMSIDERKNTAENYSVKMQLVHEELSRTVKKQRAVVVAVVVPPPPPAAAPAPVAPPAAPAAAPAPVAPSAAVLPSVAPVAPPAAPPQTTFLSSACVKVTSVAIVAFGITISSWYAMQTE